MNDVELTIILGFYYIGKEKGIEKFTERFNSCFGRDLSTQTILHEVSRFKNVDPSNNVTSNQGNGQHRSLWNEYIDKDKITELRQLYRSFKDQDFFMNLPVIESGEHDSIVKVNDIKDEPRQVQEYVNNQKKEYKRDPLVAERALTYAQYKCEGRCGNKLFLKKNGKHSYTEAHHLIPLMLQEHFRFSLDVEANVVSLCPMCHRLLHYGYEKQELLKSLYEQRKKRLEACGLFISYEKLLLLYSGNADIDE